MSGLKFSKRNKRITKIWKVAIQGLPLAGAIASVFLPLQRLAQQFVILVVLLWLQVYLIFECLLAVR
jgi:hypothetical protein